MLLAGETLMGGSYTVDNQGYTANLQIRSIELTDGQLVALSNSIWKPNTRVSFINDQGVAYVGMCVEMITDVHTGCWVELNGCVKI